MKWAAQLVIESVELEPAAVGLSELPVAEVVAVLEQGQAVASELILFAPETAAGVQVAVENPKKPGSQTGPELMALAFAAKLIVMA